MPSLIKNNAIEFYRFLFAVVVYMIHSAKIIGGGIPWLKGYLGVEFFFILGGFLLFKHFENCTSITSVENYNFEYFKQRVRRLFPQHIFSWICMCFISVELYNNTWKNIISNSYSEFLLLQSFGFPASMINGVVWYLSALLFATYCISFLILKNKSTYIYMIAPIAIGVGYGYIAEYYHTLNQHQSLLSFVRAFSDMSLGCLSYCLYKKFMHSRLNNWIITTIFESMALTVLVIYCAFGMCINDFLFSFICVFFIVSVFSNTSKISQFLNNKYSAFLGKISFAFYLNQNVVKHLINYWLFSSYNFSPFTKACILILSNILFSIFTMWLIDLIRKKSMFIHNKFLSKSIVQ